MTPDTVHRLAQEIRQQRALLTVEQTWVQKQEWTTMRDEAFQVIDYKRRVLKFAEHLLANS